MGIIEIFRFYILPYWKSYVLFLLPLILLPLLLNDNGGKEGRAAYVIIIMAIYWMTEALPLAVTSLLPVVLFPLLGIMDTGKVCPPYMKETNMMFIGGLTLALAVEYSNLHRRIALRVLLYVGASPRWLMLGFMTTTMFLSMWISNTATTAMIVPIVDAITEELFKDDEKKTEMDTNFHTTLEKSSMTSSSVDSADSVVEFGNSCQEITEFPGSQSTNNKEKIRNCLLISVAYASNIGGTGSLLGSSPQLALKGIYQDLYGSSRALNFASWMALNVPGMLINTFLAWIWLQYLFMGFNRSTNKENERSTTVKRLIQRKYEELGPVTFHELAILFLFITCVLLWFFRDPQFITGWVELLHIQAKVDDATVVMAVAVFLFILPAKPKFRWFSQNKEGERDPDNMTNQTTLVNWKFVQDRIPWGVFLLLGSGYALSDASKVSGLSSWLGAQLTGLSVLPPFAIMLVICIMTAIITEVASNTATANILLPILADMANTLKINPLYLMLPATVTCSYAFCLPVATPPNAIVFAAAKMKSIEMIKAGFLMNIVCVFVICLLMFTFGSFIFGSEDLMPMTETLLLGADIPQN